MAYGQSNSCGNNLKRFAFVYSVPAFYLRQCVTLTGKAVVGETTAFVGPGDTKSNAKGL